MLKIDPIKNVNHTLNKTLAFGAGVQTNRGVEVAPPEFNVVEGGLLTGFVGTIAPAFQKTKERADSIQKGLEVKRLDFVA